MSGAWIQTYSGRKFFPWEPFLPDSINIVDIAHALSMICRYNGHCRFFYSVAEHSVHVSRHLPPELQFAGLMHDASEAYLGDVPRPLKPQFDDYRAAEETITFAIAQRYGLPYPEHPEVKRVDTAILADEQPVLMPNVPADWGLTEPPLGVTIEGWPPERAKAEFLRRFEKLAP